MDLGKDAYRRYLDGDDAAFCELIDMYADPLIFFIRRYVPSLADCEDIAEDCFAELIIHKGRYNFKTQLKTYLFGIAHHKAVSFVRRAKFRTGEPIDETVSDEYAGFEEKILTDERNAVLNRALASLAPDYRTVLHLIYYEELSYGEVARVMRKTKKQVENLAYRGRLALKDKLMKEGITQL